MKTLIVTVVTALFGTGSVWAQSYTIQGTAPESENGKTVYMTEYEHNTILDSAVVRDGQFTFIRTDSGIRRLDLGRELYANLIAEPGTITVDMNNPLSVGGTPLNDSLSVLLNRRELYFDTIDRLWADSTQTRDEKQRQDKLCSEQYMSRTIAVYRANRTNFMGAYVLMDIAYDMEPERYITLYEEGGTTIRNYGPLKDYLKAKEFELMTLPGKPFVDFEGMDAAGRVVKLSDYVGQGKYVLVDFWASWCGPCREEMPVLARVYGKYKDKGVEVVGLFVWDKPENLAPAVSDLKITWPQIIDSNSTVRHLYGINGIPYIMLFGPDGTILARDLRGERIEQEIARYIP